MDANGPKQAGPFSSSAGGNSPFAANGPQPLPPGSENPYQSPSAYAPFGPGPMPLAWELRTYAEARVSGPATALIVLGAIGVALHLMGLLVRIVGLAAFHAGGGGGGNDPFAVFLGNGFVGIGGGILADGQYFNPCGGNQDETAGEPWIGDGDRHSRHRSLL